MKEAIDEFKHSVDKFLVLLSKSKSDLVEAQNDLDCLKKTKELELRTYDVAIKSKQDEVADLNHSLSVKRKACNVLDQLKNLSI